jgi:hypothetical protein
MGSFGQVPLKDIWAMLDICAPGHTRKAREHNHCIQYSGRTFPSLPLGKHGKRDNPPIELGHVRQMVRQLGLDPDCVKRFLPQLKLR